jgi:CheY-like chemotaxis protein
VPSILLIEDNPSDVLLVREALEEYGVDCEVFVATDGERAVQFIEQAEASVVPCPDLIVLDLNLPKRTGFEVLRVLRDNPTLGRTRVVILSSSDAPRDREDTARLGISDYIRKPTRLEEFLKIGAVLKGLLGE